MSFGTIIKKLRRERDLTQEELAEILSISPQAVSRWENDVAMPDISLIPTLCNYFNVSADMLLGIDVEKKKQKIEEICNEALKYFSRGYNDKAKELLSAGLREYPDSFEIMRYLMYVIHDQYNWDQSRKDFRDEAIKLGEAILAKCTDDEIRESAIQILCYCYGSAGRTEDAVKLAKSASCIAISSEILLSGIYEGDKGYDAYQTEIRALFEFLSNALNGIAWAKHDYGEFIYTDEEKSALFEKRIALIRLFFEDDNFGFYHTHLYETYKELAVYYARIGDTVKALENLRSAAENAIDFDKSADGGKYTSLIMRNSTHGSWSGNSTENDSALLLKSLDDTVFDTIRDSPEFAEIKAMLQANSAKWQVK